MPRLVLPGEATERYHVDAAAGRYLVIAFVHSAGHPAAGQALFRLAERTDIFNDSFASLFAISSDPADKATSRLTGRIPGFRVLWDLDLAASRLCGAAPADPADGISRRAIWIVCDPTLRLIEIRPFEADGSECDQLIKLLEGLPPPDRFAGFALQAPILFLPRVFEPDFCGRLIDLYEQQGGESSGVMRQIGGRTVGVHDTRFKVRRDVSIADPGLMAEIQRRVIRRVVPEIAKVHQFHVTRMERYLVACYAAEDGGHFSPHRDNTTAGTAHRRFALSVNLNDDFEGGEVVFPEYGAQRFKAPLGGAVVFSCSLLHAVSPVTRGRRYAFLPFLYDDAAARLREANRHLLDEGSTKAGP